MLRLRAYAGFAALALAALAAPLHAGTKPWTLDDILAVRTVSDPQVSPDGRSVAYVVQELKEGGADYQTDVWLIPVSGGEARRLTASPVADEQPRWSPDGRWIAFLSDRPRPDAKGDDAEARRQIWLIRPDGGEATVLTSAAGGVSAIEWSRDGRLLAYLSREPKSDERRQREKDRDDAWTPASQYAWNRLWTIDVATREARQLTSGDFHVTGFSLAPDGRQICVASQPTPLLPDGFRSDLWLVPVAGGAPRPLVQRKGVDENPRWSPDGRWIAFESQDGRSEEWWTNEYLCMVPAAGGQPVNLTADFDERPNGGPGSARGTHLWLPDSRSIVFQSLWRTTAQLFSASADAPAVTPVTRGGDVNLSPSASADGRVLAFVRQNAETPADVWVYERGVAEPRRLTDANPQVRDFLSFPKTVLRWKGPGGLDIDGLLISPAGSKPGVRVPLVLNVHGGPASAHLNTFSAGGRAYPWPLFVQDGWAVLLPNPRGSGGYGEAFRKANVRDWGRADYEDLMAGVNTLIGLGLVDSTRLAVCGWSYGGFMTSTIVTRTDRFRAAVVGAGVVNLSSMAGTCDIPEFNRSYFESWPWEDPQEYVDHSALFHAGRVKTPTSLVHGGSDDRVPTSQGWEFYNALKRVGVPTDLLVLPRQPHNAREPRLQRAVMTWHYDWLTRWTLGRPPKPAAQPATRTAPGAQSGGRTGRQP